MPYYRNDSEFGPGPRVPMSNAEKQAWFDAVCKHRRVRELSSTGIILCQHLIKFLGSDGQLDLAHETMATLSGCCIVTIKRQLRILRRLGFINWKRRLVRVADSTEQTSNAYVLTLPKVVNREPLEQKDREVTLKFNLSTLVSRSLKAARAEHKGAQEHKRQSVSALYPLQAQQEREQNSTVGESDYEREQKRFEAAHKMKLKRNRNNWGKSGDLGAARNVSIEDEYAWRNAERQLNALGHSKI